MRRIEVLYAVIVSIVGTVLTMAVGTLAPLGAKDEPVDLNAERITCRELKVVDEEGNTKVTIGADDDGGYVAVIGKDGKGWAAMSIDGDGGAVDVWGKGARARMGVYKDGNGDFSSWDENGNRLE